MQAQTTAPEDVQSFAEAADKWTPYGPHDRLEHGIFESGIEPQRVEDRRDDPLLRGFIIDGMWLVRRRLGDRHGRNWVPRRSMKGVTERWRIEKVPPDS